MANYDQHFFERETRYISFTGWEYIELETDEKFEKLYRYILDLEERIEQLESKSDDCI